MGGRSVRLIRSNADYADSDSSSTGPRRLRREITPSVRGAVRPRLENSLTRSLLPHADRVAGWIAQSRDPEISLGIGPHKYFASGGDDCSGWRHRLSSSHPRRSSVTLRVVLTRHFVPPGHCYVS